jgi:CMP/dCMP kinase
VIVAIDGPAGSGKSTTARRVAERLGWLYLDTGAMYRAVALAFQDAGLPFTSDAAGDVLSRLALDLHRTPEGMRVLLDGEDVTGRIRTKAAGEAASRVSALPEVRDRLVHEQRRIAQDAREGGVVIEGRDIGTVVFPRAEVKIFLIADVQERARRRMAELQERGQQADLDEVAAEIVERDRRDTDRTHAPLRQAEDAVVIDTTGFTLDEQVDRVIEIVGAR